MRASSLVLLWLVAGCEPREVRTRPIACFHIEPPHGDTRSSSTTGAVEGVAVDIDSGEALAGVTIAMSGSALMQMQNALSDENGAFRIADLPAGEYQLTIYYDDITSSDPRVRVADGAVTVVRIRIDPRPPATVRQQ